MRTAGGRLFVDTTAMLASPVSRENVLNTLGQSDPLIKDALMTILERGDFIKSLPIAENEQTPGKTIYRLRVINRQSTTIRQSFLI